MCKNGPEDSEYFEEWENRDPELSHMSLEDYDYMRSCEDYGYDNDYDDDDSNDPYY